MSAKLSQEELYRNCTLGGPGMDGYAYRAAVYCIPCGRDIIRQLANEGKLPQLDDCLLNDSETAPQPIFFGESDWAEHCDRCEKYLYGKREED